MSIELDPDLEREIERQAKAHGYEQASDYLRSLVGPDEKATDHATEEVDLKKTEAWRHVQHLKGTATRGLTADQIMEETRSEV